jgi:hypothetical protein
LGLVVVVVLQLLGLGLRKPPESLKRRSGRRSGSGKWNIYPT